jgi:CRISPR-associated protein Cas1
MALEGQAREQYYFSFNTILSDEEYRYVKRERRPPKTKLDTLLSFGNSLLYVTVLGEIYKTHLDPRIGFLHSSNDRRFSLNLDVAEVFKPIIVDRVIFTLVNKKMLDASCFMEELGGLYLNDKGRKTFVQEYESKLKQTITCARKLKASYKRLIRLELYKLEKHLIGDKEYEPFVAQW